MKRVLIVEDQADIRKLIRMTLEFENYEIHEASDGSFGLRMAQAIRPDVLLLDVMMPGMSGPELLAELRRRELVVDIPVILMTAKSMPDELAALMEHAVTGIIVKPFDPISLPSDIAMYWQLARERRHG